MPNKTRPMTLPEFMDRFGTEQACREFLFHNRWPDGFRCPRCGSSEAYAMRTRPHWKCKACGHQVSVTAGTIMHKSHLPLTTWFLAIYLVSQSKRGISALELSKQIGRRYETAWHLLHKIRRVMSDREAERLREGMVEMDDAYFGGVSHGRVGRGTAQVPAVVAVSIGREGTPAFGRIVLLPDLRRESGDYAAKRILAEGAHVLTDGLGTFRGLSDLGFKHQVVPGGNLLGEDDRDPFPYVHTFISNAKAWINGTFHGLGRRHLQSYLNEFSYRFNRRWGEDRIFERLLRACVAHQPVVVS
jgi:transposase-like protein